ncbi:MAG: hypothetical protein CM15mP74_10920 [Halieaceae bacterium]|nr:MAG: hypothetical protein CM15mP74_10920 [Halieaceae bacterium]
MGQTCGALGDRMEAPHNRYLQQFTVMESLVNTFSKTPRVHEQNFWENMGNFGKD